MRFKFFLLIILSVIFCSDLSAQTSSQSDEEIIKVTTELVQIDFLVLDDKGSNIKSLSPDDIEIFQDGKPQEIVNFSYIDSKNKTTQLIIKNKKKSEIAVPPIPTNSKQNGRLITFVIDDGNCNSSLDGLSSARDSLKKFINEQMLPDDRVAIYQTKDGSSLFRQYTSNKDQLLRIISKINLSAQGPNCGRGIFDSVNANSIDFNDLRQDKLNERTRDNSAEGSIGVLKYVTERLKNVPGRKSIFFLSEGLAVSREFNAAEALNVLSNSALRSSVVFYTIDTRGLFDSNSIRAEDSINGNITDSVREKRRTLVVNTREGLEKLAESTGGEFIRDKTPFDKEISEIVQRENGYYLLGYQPQDETFKGKNFHKIEIKLKNPNLRLFSRNGFYGTPDTTNKPKTKSADSPLFQALTSPLQEAGIEIKITPMFVNDAAKGNIIRTLLNIRGEDLTFAAQPNGEEKLSLDVVIIVFDEKGKIVIEQNRTHKIQISKADLPVIRKNGLSYSSDIAVKTKGNYSIQVAVRDNTSNQLGSVGDFLEIPEFNRDKILLAGFITGEEASSGSFSFPEAKNPNESLSLLGSSADSSLRKYRLNDLVGYSYTIYNAKNHNNLTSQIRIYKEGKQIVESKENSINIIGQDDLSRIKITNSFRINASVLSGTYVLQIIVRDKTDNKVFSQWIDFEVVN